VGGGCGGLSLAMIAVSAMWIMERFFILEPRNMSVVPAEEERDPMCSNPFSG
jgi:hypothetical protein